MKETRKLLMDDYNKVNDLISVAEPGTPVMESLLKDRDNIRNELIKVDSQVMDTKVKNVEIEAENKREKKRNILNIVTFGVSTIISSIFVLATFNFDREHTVTSTLGRGILGNILPKRK